MTRTTIRLAVAAVIGLWTAAQPSFADEGSDAKPPENPYEVFVVRNPFNIRPAPPQTNAVPVVQEQTNIEIKLTGITFFGKKMAYFQVTEKGKATEPRFLTLCVEDQEDGFEVLEIDEVNSQVRVRQNGAETLMTFLSHGIAGSVSSGPSAPAPGGTRNLVTPIPANTPSATSASIPVPGVAPRSENSGNLRTIPSRNMRRGVSGGMDPELARRYGLTPPGSDDNSLPVVRAPDPPEHNLSTEEQIILMELQKVTRPDINFPPTPGVPTPGAGIPGQVPQPGAPGIPFPVPPQLPGGMAPRP